MKLVDVAVRRPVTIWMFTFAVILFGLVSLSRLSINLLPDLSYPTLTIRTDYIGAAPSEVEQLVSKPIEETIGTVKGVRKVHSISKADQSDVVLEFEWGVNMDLASLEVREKLDILQLPLDVKSPLLLKFNPSLDPIMRLGLQNNETAGALNAGALSAGALNAGALNAGALKVQRTYAEEQIKRKLESLPGVASVKIGGGLEQEIQVLIDPQKTGQLNIAISAVVNRLRSENINQAGGKVEDGSQTFLVRSLNQFKNLDDIRNIFIATVAGKNIRLADIATVTDHHKERSSITRVNGDEAIEIAIYKEGDANTVAVAQRIKSELDGMKKHLPEKYRLALVYDQSVFIDNAISEVKNAGIIGGLLAMLVLFFFLKNIWSTLIISLSIPVSVIATFNLMYGNDISLNIMSLGGIALAVGLLVDNSIVVLENIARRKAAGEPGPTAAKEGTKEVAMAITASTLTTMAVFFPLVFVEGIAGQLFSDQALTVTFALLASLIIAITLIPMLSSRGQNNTANTATDDNFVKPAATADKPGSDRKAALFFWTLLLPFKLLLRVIFYFVPLGMTLVVSFIVKGLSQLLGIAFKPLLWAFDKVYNGLARAYAGVLKRALSQRLLFVGLISAICAGSVLLLPKLGMELIPSMSQGEFFVEVSLPAGTPLQQTDATIKQLATLAKQDPRVKNSYALAGTGSLMNASPSQGGDHWGRLNVVLKDGSTLDDEKALISRLRQAISRLPGVEAKFGKAELFSFNTPLAIELAAYDLTALNAFANEVVKKLQDNARFADVKSTLRDGHPELKVHFNHARLAQLGLNASDVSQLLSSQIGGDVATQYTINDRKIDVLVRTREQDRNSVSDIRALVVNPGSDRPIPLSAVATVTESVGPGEITRIGQQRVAIVSANLGYGDLSQAVAEARAALAEMNIPLNIQARITGQSEEMDSSFQSLQFALLLAVFLVYIVMASQFESFLHPLLILFTVPLAAAGSIFGLYLSGTHISIMVFIGLIMLSGIVVNNAIVLIDRINQLRGDGVEKMTAIIDAATSRLRPIVMTTITTTLGLLPLAIGGGDGAEIRAPMAITVIYGLIFATLLTLIFIPVIYSLFDQKRFAPAQSRQSGQDTAEASPVTTATAEGAASHV